QSHSTGTYSVVKDRASVLPQKREKVRDRRPDGRQCWGQPWAGTRRGLACANGLELAVVQGLAAVRPAYGLPGRRLGKPRLVSRVFAERTLWCQPPCSRRSCMSR